MTKIFVLLFLGTLATEWQGAKSRENFYISNLSVKWRPISIFPEQGVLLGKKQPNRSSEQIGGPNMSPIGPRRSENDFEPRKYKPVFRNLRN